MVTAMLVMLRMLPLRVGSDTIVIEQTRELAQMTSLIGEKAHLLYKPHISCPYKQCGTKSHNLVMGQWPQIHSITVVKPIL